MSSEAPTAPQKINLRRPDIMEAVQAQVLSHYRSELVERIRANGRVLSADDLTVKLAKEFGFCYGVERAIDLAYAARNAFPRSSAFSCSAKSSITPRSTIRSVNMGIRIIAGKPRDEEINPLRPEDIVIIPAVRHRGCHAQKTGRKGLPICGHHLRRRDERLETRAPILQGFGHQHHSRQGLARGNQGHQLAGARQRQRPLPGRVHAGRD